jgi:signal transduction histidine kinase
MTEITPISELEIANLRNSVNLLLTQGKIGRVNPADIVRHMEKIEGFLSRVQGNLSHDDQSGQFEALYNVSRLLGSSLDLQTVLDQVMDAIIQLSGAERGFLMLRDDDGGLTVKAARNLDQQTLTNENFKYSRTVTNQVLDSGKPILTTNAAEDPRFAGQQSIISQSIRSIMATPLRARGNVIGVVYVDSSILAGLFKQDDLNALDAFSGQAAVALDNALLFSATDEALSKRVDELQQLRRIDLLLNQTLEADKAIAYTLEWACKLSGAESGHLGLMEGNPPHIHAVHHYGKTSGDAPEFLDEAYPNANKVIASGEPLVLNADNEAVATVYIAPILRENKPIGVVTLQRTNGGTFTPDQQDIVQRIVARAAVAIENARLYAAAQAADKAKSEFVGIVAHDLKSPMTSIKGYAEMALMYGGLDERQKFSLNTIKDTVERMEILVSDLADISRIESGVFYMNETRFLVESALQAVKDGTMPQIQERGHTFVEKIEPNLPDVQTDYYRLLQVLINLVSNAYKYTPNGGTITLSAKRNGKRVEFLVKDSGIGLSEAAIAKLGEKFWRAEDAFTRAQPGTGLGFSITRSLVEQMGSQIKIESEVGKGSTFTFSVAIAE